MCAFQGIPDHVAQSAQEGATTNLLRMGEEGTRLGIVRPEPIKLPELVDKESLQAVDESLRGVIREGNAMTRRYIASQVMDEVCDKQRHSFFIP